MRRTDVRRVDPDFSEYIKKIQKSLSDSLGRDVTFTEATRFVGKINVHPVIIIRKGRRRKDKLEDPYPF